MVKEVLPNVVRLGIRNPKVMQVFGNRREKRRKILPSNGTPQFHTVVYVDTKVNAAPEIHTDGIC